MLYDYGVSLLPFEVQNFALRHVSLPPSSIKGGHRRLCLGRRKVGGHVSVTRGVSEKFASATVSFSTALLQNGLKLVYFTSNSFVQ